MVHTVKNIDGEAVIFCGDKVIFVGEYEDINWNAECPNCGQVIRTFRNFPYKEYEYASGT